MSEYFGQHRENDWKLWNLPQFLSIPPEDVGVWGIPFAKRCDHIPARLMPFNYAIGKDADFTAGVHFLSMIISLKEYGGLRKNILIF